MKMLSSLLLFLSVGVSAAPVVVPMFQDVELKEFTSMEVDLMPDAGTQLIFPFMLDNPDLTPEVKITLTNKDGFAAPTSEGEMKGFLVGQNTITIMGKLSKGAVGGGVFLGTLFVTIGGYHITLSLRTTYDSTKHVTNYVFRMDEEERNFMIENAVKNRLKDLEGTYRKKLDALDSGGGKSTLTALTKISPLKAKTKRIKTRLVYKINGAKIETDVSHFTRYGSRYGTLSFTIRNMSDVSFDIGGISFYGSDKDGTEMLIDGEYDCDRPLDPDSSTSCVFATRDTEFMDYKTLKLVLTTGQGTGEVEW